MITKDPHAEALQRLLAKLPPVVVQNRLMATSDRDIALALLYFSHTDREPVLSAVSRAKRARVEDEILLQERLRISRKHYEMAVAGLIRALEQNSAQRSSRSYLRPLRRRPSE